MDMIIQTRSKLYELGIASNHVCPRLRSGSVAHSRGAGSIPLTRSIYYQSYAVQSAK
jgi:hypothetical protein